MNPSFYPKHLARQYAQNGALRNQNEGHPGIPNFESPWAQVYPLPGGENSHFLDPFPRSGVVDLALLLSLIDLDLAFGFLAM